jgi:mannose-6-phosphate isomerase-like protein (cupin superfamily)
MGASLAASIEFREQGIIVNGEQMSNGEIRFRMIDRDGNGYIRTETTVGGWQNSHSHKTLSETYVVERGWMGFAKLVDKNLAVTVLSKGGMVTTPVGICHNVYLPAGAIIHTIKHGGICEQSDWFPCPHLDELSKKLSEDEIFLSGY